MSTIKRIDSHPAAKDTFGDKEAMRNLLFKSGTDAYLLLVCRVLFVDYVCVGEEFAPPAACRGLVADGLRGVTQ